jgi:hypothetical protein
MTILYVGIDLAKNVFALRLTAGSAGVKMTWPDAYCHRTPTTAAAQSTASFVG